jgi:hypothetical protein
VSGSTNDAFHGAASNRASRALFLFPLFFSWSCLVLVARQHLPLVAHSPAHCCRRPELACLYPRKYVVTSFAADDTREPCIEQEKEHRALRAPVSCLRQSIVGEVPCHLTGRYIRRFRVTPERWCKVGVASSLALAALEKSRCRRRYWSPLADCEHRGTSGGALQHLRCSERPYISF